MSTATNQTPAVPSTPTRIILASAHRHERRSTSRQERACKALRKMGRFYDSEALDSRRLHLTSLTDEILDE